MPTRRTFLKGVAAMGLPCAAWAAPAPAEPEPRYVFLNANERAGWFQNRPESYTRACFDEVARAVDAPANPALRVGVSTIFSLLNAPTDVLAQSVRGLLRGCEQSSVPLLVTLDGQNWWGNRPDLWNWWDPKQPGYNPENVQNVEWTGWDPATAVKIGWRNWGRQIRVLPAPNLASPRVLDAHAASLRALAPLLAEWQTKLPKERAYLFGGVKVGWEASTGYNAFYYPGGNRLLEQWPDDDSHDPRTGLDAKKGLSGGAAPIGYAAVKTAGLKSSGAITPEDLGEVVRRYLERLARTVVEAGVPKERVYTHQGGTYGPWGTHYPFSPAFNKWSSPGWSFYWQGPETAGDLAEQMRRLGSERWCAAEWLWPGKTADEWKEHLRRTLAFRDCRFVCIYNWDPKLFAHDGPASTGLRGLVAEWK